ncbi:MAG: hypothetical protein OEM41_04035 [Ignavibacteria bacterium]|nr:hypothetical protein [Ignavibacteria bacterium]
MKQTTGSLLAIGLTVALLMTGCGKKEEEQKLPPEHPPVSGNQGQPALPPSHPPIGSGSSSASAGISWVVPSAWQEQGPRQMRVATYTVPAASADAEAGECAVFYFGSDQGGNVEMNIERWASQFEGSPKPERSTKKVNGMGVAIVKIAGTFLAPGGPMMQSQGKKEDFRLLGAIVDAPEGSVFFKFTGPTAVVSRAEKDFTSMIESIKK